MTIMPSKLLWHSSLSYCLFVIPKINGKEAYLLSAISHLSSLISHFSSLIHPFPTEILSVIDKGKIGTNGWCQRNGYTKLTNAWAQSVKESVCCETRRIRCSSNTAATARAMFLGERDVNKLSKQSLSAYGRALAGGTRTVSTFWKTESYWWENIWKWAILEKKHTRMDEPSAKEGQKST